MLTKRRACDDKEAIVCEARDGEVTFDAAALVQALCINNRSNGLIDIVRANIVQEFQGAGSAHLQFIERCFVKETRVLASHKVFIPDGTRPIMARPAFRFMAVSR